MSLLAAAGSAALALLIAVTAHTGLTLLSAAIALVVVCLALGWPILLGMEHARRSAGAVIVVSGLVAVLVAVRAADGLQPLAAFAVVLAACVMLAFAHQLVRRDGRIGLTETITGTVSGQVMAVLGAGWLLLPGTRLGLSGLLVAVVALVVCAGVAAAPVEAGWRGWAAFAAGAAAAVVTAAVVAGQDLAATALVGIAVAAVGAGTAVLLQAQDAVRTPLGLLAAAAGPVSAVGTVAYAVARLAGG